MYCIVRGYSSVILKELSVMMYQKGFLLKYCCSGFQSWHDLLRGFLIGQCVSCAQMCLISFKSPLNRCIYTDHFNPDIILILKTNSMKWPGVNRTTGDLCMDCSTVSQCLQKELSGDKWNKAEKEKTEMTPYFYTRSTKQTMNIHIFINHTTLMK